MQVTGQLWQLVVVHAELPAHLAALKNYFLLAKGDFYHSFLAEVMQITDVYHSSWAESKSMHDTYGVQKWLLSVIVAAHAVIPAC